LLTEFMFGKPGAPRWEQRVGTELFVDRKAYTKALLYIRKHGATYLRAISISALRSMATDFLKENFWYIGRAGLILDIEGPYLSHVTKEDKSALADALAASPLFHPAAELTLYPLVPVRVTDRFDCERFFLIAAGELSSEQLPPEAARRELSPSSFPPFLDLRGVRHKPSAWLGVRSPLELVSNKMRAAIMGAVALTLLPRYRYQVTRQTVFGGRCTIAGNEVAISRLDEPHAPPLANDITITRTDHAWLTKLAALLDATDKSSRSQVRALEYFYRAWFLDPRERFPVLCMTLDSLVGYTENHTDGLVKYVKSTVDPSVDDKRLRLLMGVRGDVVHGRAPDVYDSKNYIQYYCKHQADPIFDLELIVARCLRVTIFSGDLAYHKDPNSELREELRAKGRLSRNSGPDAIIAVDW
jgi:hypothetical protein